MCTTIHSQFFGPLFFRPTFRGLSLEESSARRLWGSVGRATDTSAPQCFRIWQVGAEMLKSWSIIET
jgi:hypothetical protein